MKSYFLGIDGGGTRTTAWLGDEDGRVVARAVAGPSNPLKVGFEACERELLRAAAAVLGKARAAPSVGDHRSSGAAPKRAGLGGRPSLSGGASGRVLEALCVGLAGVDRHPVHARIFAWLRKMIPARVHLLTSDAAIALYAAVHNTPAIIVISGTGSIAFARDKRANVLRSGGWGTDYDDLGSGFDIGRRAIVAALRDYDGRGESTVLGTKICRALSLRDITQIILKRLTPQDVAALFPLVLEAARRRDAVARSILDIAAQDLSELACALTNRLGWKQREFPVVCAGGVFSASARLRNRFSRSVRKLAPRARVVLLRKQPVEGALNMARALAKAR